MKTVFVLFVCLLCGAVAENFDEMEVRLLARLVETIERNLAEKRQREVLNDIRSDGNANDNINDYFRNLFPENVFAQKANRRPKHNRKRWFEEDGGSRGTSSVPSVQTTTSTIPVTTTTTTTTTPTPTTTESDNGLPNWPPKWPPKIPNNSFNGGWSGRR